MRRSLLTLATLVGVCALQAGLSILPARAAEDGQDPDGPRLEDLLPSRDPEMRAHFDVSVEMVRIPVIVEGPLGGFVTGMVADEFRVREAKLPPQPIRHLVTDDAPSSVGILVDGSVDVADDEAAIRHALEALIGSLRSGDEAFLTRFAGEVEMLHPFSEVRPDLESQATSFSASGSSERALHDAIALGLIRMRSARHDKRALVVFVDGGDRGSEVDPADLRTAARRDGVAIHAVVLSEGEPRWRDRVGDQRPDEHEAVDHEDIPADEVTACRAAAPSSTACLQQLAHDTGGLVALRPGVEDRFGGFGEWLALAAADVGAYVRHQYVLVYEPPRLPPRGVWRNLRVGVTVPYSRVRARAGYIR